MMTFGARHVALQQVLLAAGTGAIGIEAARASDPAFTDQTFFAGVSVQHVPSTALESSWISISKFIAGAAVGDFNRDGFQDFIFLSGGVQPDRLFINDGDGTFTNRAFDWGVASVHMGIGAAVGDYNNDGWSDLYITSLGTALPVTAKHRLYRNVGGASFVNVAEGAGVHRTSTQVPDGLSPTFGDYDLDGDLDLYVAGWVLISDGNRLFRNNGDGTFTDITVEAGVNHQTVRAFTPRFADMDGDGYPELLVAADFGTSRYYVNQRDGTFIDATIPSGTGLDDNGMGQTIGDFDNDGRFEWYVTSVYSKDGGTMHVPGTGNMLYHNLGDHEFSEIATQSNVADGGWGWGVAAVDFNNDGLLDIAETNGWTLPNAHGEYEWTNHPSFLYMNIGDLDFENHGGAASGFNFTGQGRGLMTLDYNVDGRQDLLVTSYSGPLRLYRNDTPQNEAHWLRIELDTSAHPHLAPDGSGTVVRATAGDVTQSRMICGGSNYLSQSELTAHFGFGSLAIIDEVRIEWNNGVVTELHDVPADQALVIAAGPLGDLDGDGEIGTLDLLLLLDGWGDCPDEDALCPSDLNRDCCVNVLDLVSLLNVWQGTVFGD